MPDPAKRDATYHDYLALGDEARAELVYGSLYVHPAPAPPHGSSQFSLSVQIGAPFQTGNGGPGGWWFMITPEQHLGPHIVQPDLAGWRKERMPKLPDGSFVEIVPDWVCEILSPSTESLDRSAKRRLYATYGVGHLWYLHPVARYLEVLELRNGSYAHLDTFTGTEPFRAPPFDAIALNPVDLWPMPPPASGFQEERTPYVAAATAP
jgi:Uma2 family endonuclease